jgi:hypothetical protein
MMHDAARAKLAELYGVEPERVDALIAARGDTTHDPDPSGMNAHLRGRAFRNRVVVELDPMSDAKAGGE